MSAGSAKADAGGTAPVDSLLKSSGVCGLGKDPSRDQVGQALRKLVETLHEREADALTRELAVRGAKAELGTGWAKVVDAAFAEATGGDAEAEAGGLALSDPEPWPDPVEGAGVLDALVRTFSSFLSLPEGAATALALWTLHAHTHDAAHVSPLLAITSATHRCGKSLVLTVLRRLTPRPLDASNISPAALFRGVEKYRPTLLVDEADTFLREREELRGVLNSGHTRAGAQVIRAVESGGDYDVQAFSTWCPKAVAMIGKLPNTLDDRSIEIRMRRKAKSEAVARWKEAQADELEPLRRRCARWAADHLDGLRGADPDVPRALNDRAADNWRALIAIADAAGGEWPERGRKAAKTLSGDGGDDDAAGPMLLGDLRDLFRRQGTDRLSSADIVDALVEMEERPWPEWKRGDPITKRQLARVLKPFDIKPKAVKIGGKAIRGYLREDFQDAFERYLPSPEGGNDPLPPQPSSNGAENGTSAIRNRGGQVTDRKTAENPHRDYDVTDVTDQKGGAGKDITMPADVFEGEGGDE